MVNKFLTGGIHTLLRAAPSAVVIPFVISGHRELMHKGSFPLALGQKISYTVLDPLEPKGKDVEKMVLEIQSAICKELGQN
jgi:1-acyl-sn-glycerol-3-phosphate acyltransferase